MKQQDSTPRCPHCGADITTGLMAVYCEKGDACHYFPADNTQGNQDFVRSLRDEGHAPFGDGYANN